MPTDKAYICKKGLREMRVMIWSVRNRKRWLAAVICLAAAVLLMCFPQAVQTGVRRGLALTAQLLVPSLFPFLCLSGFLIRSGIAAACGRRLSPLMRRTFGFSGSAAAAMIISMLGGYPAGGAAVSQLIAQGEIDRDEGKRLLCCCVNAGPAFIIGGVGVGMLGSVKAGLLLLLAHLTASLIVAFTCKTNRHTAASPMTPAKPCGLATAFTDSVHTAASAIIAMCGFVLLSSAVLSLTDALSLTSPVCRYLLAAAAEVTNGCVEGAAMGVAAPFCIGAALGFGGLSVTGQILAVTASYHLIDTAFFRCRLLHALLGGGLSTLLFSLFPPDDLAVSAAASLSAFHDRSIAVGAAALVALMAMCVLFLCTLPEREQSV